jgi:hypothetical protein
LPSSEAAIKRVTASREEIRRGKQRENSAEKRELDDHAIEAGRRNGNRSNDGAYRPASGGVEFPTLVK